MYYNAFKLAKSEKNQVVLFGGNLDKTIPTQELANSFGFDFQLFNKSFPELSAKNAKELFTSQIKPLHPEGIILHLGDKDSTLFKANSSDFDSAYLSLIAEIRAVNPKCRIALVSLYNENTNPTIAEMNRHIKAIADSERCDFINIDNAKLWNPESRKSAISFARGMGLSIRKPLRDVAEILYSWAYKTQMEILMEPGLAG